MKNKKTDKNVSLVRMIKALWGIKLPWLLLALYVVATFAGMAGTLLMAGATGDMVDAAGNVANSVLISFSAAYIVMAITSTAGSIFSGLAGERINMSLREKLWRKLMFIPQSYFDEDGGETLVSRVTTDCDYASSLLVTLIGLVTSIFTMFGYIGNLYASNVTLSNATLVLIPISAVIGVLYSKAKYWVGRKTQAALADATCYLVERTKNLPLIKLSNMSGREREQGKEIFQEQYRMELRTGYLNMVYTGLQTLFSLASILITFILGASLVDQGILTVGDVIAFYSISYTVAISFTNLIDGCGTVRHAVGAMSRVVTVIETESENTTAGRELDVPNEDIRLVNVTFGYTDTPVLNDLSCVIPKNKVTAIIGANGSGKTTIFKLLERMYTPGQGAVYFGKDTVDTFTLASWRKTIGLVAQDCPIMEGTLRSNITYGSDHPVSDAELKEVARMANLTALVESLPDGFDSYVAPGGRNFSGGQRQCIAIARAIMHNPDYLLLDEATSSLDARSSRLVTDALQNLMKGRTTVMIAHDLASIRNADNVIFIKDGKVETCGSPAEIIKTSEQYRQFVTKEGTVPAV